jgi:alkaline phosphatase D
LEPGVDNFHEIFLKGFSIFRTGGLAAILFSQNSVLKKSQPTRIMKTQRLLLQTLWCGLLIFAKAGTAQVQSGPMLGYSDMFEVMLWVQTTGQATVHFEYWEKDSMRLHYSTRPVTTEAGNAFVAHCVGDRVQPGKKYDYELWVDGQKISFDYPLTFQTQPLWLWRTDPPDFKFAIASCFYVNEAAYDRPGKSYGSDFEILKPLHDARPDFMVWMGDNVYYREPDWNTLTGMQHRYTHGRSLPELQPLLASTHHYAIWDDHDYGPNDSDRSFWNKNMALEVFKNFWGNLAYSFEDEGVTGTFFWNDCQFFLLDDRWWRCPNFRDEGKDRDYFGEKQLNWLIDALTFSRATFKFVVNGGQIINPFAGNENMSNYGPERARLLARIAEEKISGVIFLTGDRHHSCLQKLEREGTYPLYDLTISSLTAGSHTPQNAELEAALIVPGTLVNIHNYGILELSGPRTDRKLTISACDKSGTVLWKQEIKAIDLK